MRCCLECKFFAENDIYPFGEWEKDKQDGGLYECYCHRYPKMITHKIIPNKYWCGEHKPKETPDGG